MSIKDDLTERTVTWQWNQKQHQNQLLKNQLKNANITIDLNGGSIDLEDLNHGTAEEISAQYDKIKEELNKQDSRQ